MKLKFAATAAIIHQISADQSTCPDITQDPFVDLAGPGTGEGHSNLSFDRYCGTDTTPVFGAAFAKDDSKTNTKESNCRVKCNNWPTETDDDGNKTVKLFWVRTKKRWLRTKYLQCNCRTNNAGEETCKYRRRGYNYKAQQGRSTGGDDEDENTLQISCEEPGCIHPSAVEAFNSGTIPTILDKDGNTLCTDCNLNTGRGGSWSCFDAEGNLLDSGASVPRRGWCSLGCEHQDNFNINKKMKCLWPHKLNGVDQYKDTWRIYDQLTKNKYKKVMDSEIGWKCTADLSDEAIQAALEEAMADDGEDDQEYEDENENENEEDEVEDYEEDEEEEEMSTK